MALTSASAGGPYTVKQYEVVQMGAEATPEDELTHFEWDLDNDGAFDDTVGKYATYVAEHRAKNQVGDHTVRLRVSDGRGSQMVVETTVTVVP